MRSKKRTTLILIVSVVLVTTGFHYLGWLQSIEIFLRNVISPASRSVYSWSVQRNNETKQFDSVEALQNAYIALEEDRINNMVDAVDLKLLQEENERLREMLSFVKTNTYAITSADVIGKNIDPIGSTIIVNAGTDDGIMVGNPVVVGIGVLIGRISRATPETSIVRLLDDNQSKVAATLLNEEKSIGVVEGGYGISIRMNFIPQNEAITIGDTIITSGLEDGVPRGLTIGTVETFEKEPYQPFQSAVVVPPKNFNWITSVSIIRSEE